MKSEVFILLHKIFFLFFFHRGAVKDWAAEIQIDYPAAKVLHPQLVNFQFSMHGAKFSYTLCQA